MKGRKKIDNPKENRIIRVEDDIWEKYLEACRTAGINPSEYVRIQLKKLIEKSKIKGENE